MTESETKSDLEKLKQCLDQIGVEHKMVHHFAFCQTLVCGETHDYELMMRFDENGKYQKA